ncbi:uncharacterized protein N7506_000163 [Penicillium brevicompactum]|uniref:uncharacterized protein n=1 Tax=Penicillium brevicompactum TaxID=5074 RepID=UPI0025406459|nr:uncharacterized protein N7506_000163 [Penicillium brevicompactum]KAJ5346910.1 hypothetical protein N7506_000163 [Penicillium brevicompactum]
MFEGARQSLDGPGNEETANQPSACGFDYYEPVAWVSDQLYNQDHLYLQDASIPYQTSVRGFDNYEAGSVARGSGQLYNQNHGCHQGASVPYQTSVRGFDNYDAEPIAWDSGQRYSQDARTPSGASVPCEKLAHEPNNPVLHLLEGGSV